MHKFLPFRCFVKPDAAYFFALFELVKMADHIGDHFKVFILGQLFLQNG